MNGLHCLTQFPDALFDVQAADLHRHLSGPTLFELPGREGRPLFVSVLLHGNETTGLDAIRRVLDRYRRKPLPRPLLLFVGNIAAAAAGLRTLPGQCDYNRAWPGTAFPTSTEAVLMQAVYDRVAARQPYASIDIHNNTGLNPLYACVNRLDERWLHLARLFSRTVVFFTEPVGVQSLAMARLCPAITVECGKAGEAAGVDHAAELVDAALHLDHFPSQPVPEHDLDLLRTAVIVKVPAGAGFSFDGSPADYMFRGDLDHLNFRELPPGTELGRLGRAAPPLTLVGEHPTLAAADILDYRDARIRLQAPLVPAMFSLDPNAVRLDCLCYLMQRIDRRGRPL